jgi:hypothetical protein
LNLDYYHELVWINLPCHAEFRYLEEEEEEGEEEEEYKTIKKSTKLVLQTISISTTSRSMIFLVEPANQPCILGSWILGSPTL